MYIASSFILLLFCSYYVSILLLVLPSYYAKNFAGEIDWSLVMTVYKVRCLICLAIYEVSIPDI